MYFHRPLVGDSDEEEEEHSVDEDEEEESDIKSKSDLASDLASDSDSDDIPTKKSQMKAEFEKKDYPPYTKPSRGFHSQEDLYGSPPPAYATFAGRGNARSEPFLKPFNDFDDQPTGSRNPFGRPPTRRAHSQYEPYDYDSSDSSEVQRRKRGDPRSSSFRRALFSGKPEPEPERPIDDEAPPRGRRPKPMPRKYRSLEKAVNEAAKPPSYDDDDDVDVRIRQPSSSDRYSNPPEYRSDSGRESYEDDFDRPLVKSTGPYNPPGRSESPAPAYQSSEDSSELDRLRLLSGNARPEPEISSYSSFV